LRPDVPWTVKFDLDAGATRTKRVVPLHNAATLAGRSCHL
jgi:hypothetical protein